MMPDHWMVDFLDQPMLKVLIQEMPKFSNATSFFLFKMLNALASNKDGRIKLMQL